MNYGIGEYKITFVQEGKNITLTHSKTEINGLIASFEAFNHLPAAVVVLTGKSLGNQEIIKWKWDFGNGEISEEQNPRVMFKEQKFYTISLTVISESGCENTVSKSHEWAYRY